MLVDDKYRKSVAFLCADTPADGPSPGLNRRAVGTAFFVGIPAEGVAGRFTYAITARHILNMTRARGLRPLFLRTNTIDGRFHDSPLPDDAWVEHPTTDLAAISLANLDGHDVATIMQDVLLTDEDIADRQRKQDAGEEIITEVGPLTLTSTWHFPVGVGDNVFFAGLFSPHPGRERTLPVVRFGNISLMPDEPVLVQTDDAGGVARIRAYLVEARSRGGHSGSPAFIFYPEHTGPVALGQARPVPRLLGVVQGHFETTSDLSLLGDVGGDLTNAENAGMAIVIPAQEVLDLLMSEDLVNEREETLRQIRNEEPSGTDTQT